MSIKTSPFSLEVTQVLSLRNTTSVKIYEWSDINKVTKFGKSIPSINESNDDISLKQAIKQLSQCNICREVRCYEHLDLQLSAANRILSVIDHNDLLNAFDHRQLQVDSLYFVAQRGLATALFGPKRPNDTNYSQKTRSLLHTIDIFSTLSTKFRFFFPMPRTMLPKNVQLVEGDEIGRNTHLISLNILPLILSSIPHYRNSNGFFPLFRLDTQIKTTIAKIDKDIIAPSLVKLSRSMSYSLQVISRISCVENMSISAICSKVVTSAKALSTNMTDKQEMNIIINKLRDYEASSKKAFESLGNQAKLYMQKMELLQEQLNEINEKNDRKKKRKRNMKLNKLNKKSKKCSK
jgi:hypothetical protein